jgi:hypothetical protein
MTYAATQLSTLFQMPESKLVSVFAIGDEVLAFRQHGCKVPHWEVGIVMEVRLLAMLRVRTFPRCWLLEPCLSSSRPTTRGTLQHGDSLGQCQVAPQGFCGADAGTLLSLLGRLAVTVLSRPSCRPRSRSEPACCLIWWSGLARTTDKSSRIYRSC